MWWTGHGQLFIAVFLGVVAPVVLLVSVFAVPASDVGALLGGLGTAMALPFAASGAMLRAYAGTTAATTGHLALRLVNVAVVVVLIALVSIVFVTVDVFGLMLLAGVVHGGT